MNLFGKLAEAVVVGVAGHFIAKPVIEGIENAIDFKKKLYRRDIDFCLQMTNELNDDVIMRLSELSNDEKYTKFENNRRINADGITIR